MPKISTREFTVSLPCTGPGPLKSVVLVEAAVREAQKAIADTEQEIQWLNTEQRGKGKSTQSKKLEEGEKSSTNFLGYIVWSCH